MKQLTHVSGNVLTNLDIDVVGQSCNCQNVWGSGIVIEIKKLYPDAYLADCAAAKEKRNVLGNISYAEVTRNNKLFTIVNIYGQNLHGQHKDAEGLHRKTSYEAIYCGLVRMRELVDFLYPNQNKTIGFPKRMGSDRGGASWEIIERMIEVVFDGYSGEVIIVDFVPISSPKATTDAMYFSDAFEEFFGKQ